MTSCHEGGSQRLCDDSTRKRKSGRKGNSYPKCMTSFIDDPANEKKGQLKTENHLIDFI